MAILMTGVTGILGSEIGLDLTSDEEVFYLVRESSIGKVPIWMEPDKAIIGDITQPMCGISAYEMERLEAAGIDKILHLAADVSFSPEDKEGKIRLVNFYGTKNVLDVAKVIGVKEFHYCGTCYAETRRNPYEISKDDAEKLVRQSGIPFSIYKPSAMVGDYENGEASGFNGFMGAFAVFHWITTRIREKKPGQIVNLPILAVVSSVSTMNLIPVDWVKATFIKLLRLEAKNETFFLTHDHPPLARWAIERAFEFMNIIGVRYLEKPVSREEKTRLIGGDFETMVNQRRIDPLLDQFLPYCTEERQFSLFTVRRALGDDFEEPPEITREFLRRLFEFATKKNFGMRIREQQRSRVAVAAVV